MAKHTLGDEVRHSVFGLGKITTVGVKMETPPPFDPVKLDGERWNLKARIAEIERTLERGTAAQPVDVYTVTHENGRVVEYGELGIDKLKAKLAGE